MAQLLAIHICTKNAYRKYHNNRLQRLAQPKLNQMKKIPYKRNKILITLPFTLLRKKWIIVLWKECLWLLYYRNHKYFFYRQIKNRISRRIKKTFPTPQRKSCLTGTKSTTKTTQRSAEPTDPSFKTLQLRRFESPFKNVEWVQWSRSILLSTAKIIKPGE